MQKIFLIGNLCSEPETRTTQSGASVCTFNIAVNRRFPVNGEKVSDFYRINVWRQQAESCQRYLSKGKKVSVIGELQLRTYEDKNGKTRISLDVTADEVEFLSPKADGNAPAREPSLPDVAGFENIDPDELPF